MIYKVFRKYVILIACTSGHFRGEESNHFLYNRTGLILDWNAEFLNSALVYRRRKHKVVTCSKLETLEFS